MTESNIFEKASRLKIRFNHNGVCHTEDLWDLSLEILDDMYRRYASKAKTAEEATLLKKETKKDSILNLKIDIITYIVKTKLAEKEAAEIAKTKANMKERLLALIEEKKAAELKEKSVEELNAMVKAI